MPITLIKPHSATQTEKITATLSRLIPWYESEVSQETEYKEIELPAPIAYSDRQVTQLFELYNESWQVQSLSRPSTKGGYDNDF
jgi:hypothetical protein